MSGLVPKKAYIVCPIMPIANYDNSIVAIASRLVTRKIVVPAAKQEA
jgi:hypothetical protein